MTFLRTFLVLGIFLFAAPSWAQDPASPNADEEDAKMTQLLQSGAELAHSGKPNEAIEIFDKISTSYEEKYRDSKFKILCARWLTESLFYLLDAAADNRETRVVSANWAYAYYLKAYSLLELGRITEAKALLERALALSPRNSQFLSELGSIYQLEKNWSMALQTFKLAESAAREFSPPNDKELELSRAMRGIAYVLVEQNQLDDAEKIYRQCIELNQNDTKALNELRYVLSLKAKQKAQSVGP
jgi:tetratricopeptide (TPR) repeat protein